MRIALEGKAFLPTLKWKDGGEDESILIGKWLTFHDRKWLIFKRPLTAAYLNMHPQSIYRDCYKGKLPFSRVPGIGLRIDKRELDEQLKNNQVKIKEKGVLNE